MALDYSESEIQCGKRFCRSSLADVGELVGFVNIFCFIADTILHRCWEPKVLEQMSSHYETKKPLSTELIDKIIKRSILFSNSSFIL